MKKKKITKIGKLYCEVIMNVKISLWSAIKLRIAGIKNMFEPESININNNITNETKEKDNELD